MKFALQILQLNDSKMEFPTDSMARQISLSYLNSSHRKFPKLNSYTGESLQGSQSSQSLQSSVLEERFRNLHFLLVGQSFRLKRHSENL